ncbi:MAG: ComF family protein [Gammaproteobacteria bacterium]|nr:ComF family protein [Gammaproteobacteria bacterium]
MVYNWIKFIQSILFPPQCLLCSSTNATTMDICDPCLDELPHNRHYCRICALPLPRHHAETAMCGSCLQQAPSFDHCHAAFAYDYPISNLISEFKFSGKLQSGRLLANLLINSIEACQLPLPDLIIPIPLHRSRLRERGFNQAVELARPVGRHFNIPVETHSCKRSHATATQSNLEKDARKRNVRNAFRLAGQIAHDHVVLLDDVVTTGSTVGEVARILKLNGVRRVDVWALARTPSLP